MAKNLDDVSSDFDFLAVYHDMWSSHKQCESGLLAAESTQMRPTSSLPSTLSGFPREQPPLIHTSFSELTS